MATLGCGDSGAPTTEVGKSVYNSSVATLELEDQGGGFTPQPPAGSTCLVNARKYTLTVASRKLDWSRCVGDGKAPYMWSTGSLTLTDSQLEDLTPTLENLRVVSAASGCVQDASLLMVTVTTALGSQQYADDVDYCTVTDKPYIERLTINAALDQLGSISGM